MPYPVTSIIGTRAAASSSAVDFLSLSVDSKKIASGKRAALKPKMPPPARIAKRRKNTSSA